MTQEDKSIATLKKKHATLFASDITVKTWRRKHTLGDERDKHAVRRSTPYHIFHVSGYSRAVERLADERRSSTFSAFT